MEPDARRRQGLSREEVGVYRDLYAERGLSAGGGARERLLLAGFEFDRALQLEELGELCVFGGDGEEHALQHAVEGRARVDRRERVLRRAAQPFPLNHRFDEGAEGLRHESFPVVVGRARKALLLDELDLEGLIQIATRTLEVDEQGLEVAAGGPVDRVSMLALSDDLVEAFVRERRAVLIDRLHEDSARKLEV